MTNTNALREIITKSGLKYRFIAQELKITAFSLQKKIDNITEFKASEIYSLCEILHINEKDKARIFFAI